RLACGQDDRLGVPVAGEAEEGDHEVRLVRGGGLEAHPAAGEVVPAALGGDRHLDVSAAACGDDDLARQGHGAARGTHRGGGAGVVGLGQQRDLGEREGDVLRTAVGEGDGEGGG